MSKRKGKRMVVKSEQVLKVTAYAHVVKTLNGSAPSSSHSYFLLLQPVEYSYQGYQGSGDNRKPVIKYDTAKVYSLKGVKGAIRHASMKVATKYGLEMCHTSDKVEDKKKKGLIPEGFHPLGSCQENGECLIHQVYGSKGKQSLFAVKALPITQINESTAEIPIQVQNVIFKKENRVCLSYDKKSIQDFSESYFSGRFTFELTKLDQLSPLQLGFMLQSIAHLEQMGRGETANYGKIEILNVELVERTKTKKLTQKNGHFIFEDVTTEKTLTQPVEEAWEAFNVFIENGG
jgi:hypothetical protein